MRRLIIYVLLLLVSAGSFAQQKRDTLVVITADTLKNDKTKSINIRIGVSKNDSTAKEFKKSSKFSFQFVTARVDLGLSTYTDNGSYTLSPSNSYLEHETWQSSNFGFEFFQMGYRFNSYFKIYAGAGLDWNHIRLKQNITFQKNKPALTYVTETIDFKKNRFSSRYLRIPLSIQLRTKDDTKGNKWNLVFGPEIGFLLNGKLKQVSRENGKDKFRDDFNLNPFRYGAFARMGYGGTGLYVKYYGNDVFADGQGPKDFKNLSFGIMFGF